MALTITPADLLAPEGPVEETLFPGEADEPSQVTPGSTVLEVRLQTYITRAESKISGITFPDQPTEDAAGEAWALYLTFDAAYLVAVSNPATEDARVEILGSFGFQKDQRDALYTKSLQYKSDFDAIIASVPSTAQPLGPPSRETVTEYDW